MELQTIGQVSKNYGISARMLRYYEQVGLIESKRKDDNAYRVYDEAAINRLRQIIVLRKLRVPVKQIINILNNFNAAKTLEIFSQNINQLDEEITALSTVKSILTHFVEELHEKANISLNIGWLGFDCSGGAAGIGESSHVYETWVSIPDEMQVSAPLIKRSFSGGLYAAHVLRTWDFDDWRLLKEWVNASDKYENDWGSPRLTSLETVSGQGFEETLNFNNFIQKGGNLQLDLLFPVREKSGNTP